MAMSSVYGVVAATPSKVSSSQWDASSSMLPPSELFQCRARCANSASSSSCAWALGGWEVLAISQRGSRRYGNVLGKRRRRIGVKVAAAGGEGEERRKGVSSLDELDEQLKTFERRETSAPRQVPVPQRVPGDSADQPNSENGSLQKSQFPPLSDGFFVYAGIGLLLLTVVSNVLYAILLGPGVDRKGPPKTTVPDAPRFRVTSRQQEKEAREAREAKVAIEEAQQEALAPQSREAPQP